MKIRQLLLYMPAAIVVGAALSCDAVSAATYTSILIPNNQVMPLVVNKSGMVAGNTSYGDRNYTVGFVRNTDGTVQEFGVLPDHSFNVEVSDMNDNGEIVGLFSKPVDVSHAYLRYPNGTLTVIDPPGSTSATAYNINSHGTIVGLSDVGNYIRTRDGKYTLFQPFESGDGYTCGINDAGYTAGFDASEQYGFLRAPDGTITTFTLPATAEMSVGIRCLDAQGEMVGTYADDGGFGRPHGFLRKVDGSIVTIDFPGSNGTFASSIDPHGTIIGRYADSVGITHEYLCRPDGSYHTLHFPWAKVYDGYVRNGYIVGSYPDDQGKTQGYLRTR